MKRGLFSLLATASLAALVGIGIPGAAGASEREVEHSGPALGGPITCMALHCPRPLPPELCDEAGNCEVPPDPGCYEGPDGDCLPPWCNPAAPLEECPVEPPLPPWCEDGAEVCIPPMPPWCDEEGNCEEPPLPPGCEVTVEDDIASIECLPPWCDEAGKCEPPPCQPDEETGSCWPEPCLMWGTPEDCGWHDPDDPIICVLGWPVEDPMPDCPDDFPPPICNEDGTPGEFRPLPEPMARDKKMAPWHSDYCFFPPPRCEPGTTEPGEVGVEPGDEGKINPDGSDGEQGSAGFEVGMAGDPLPCEEPPVYGCFEDEAGNILCVDPPVLPPVTDCWEVEGKPGLIACPMAEAEREYRNDRNKAKVRAKAKAKAKKAKARAKAKKAKARKAKAKAKAKKAKAKATAKARR